MTKANFGVVGMAVMGRNLALNIESRGYTVAIYNRSKEKTEDVVACHPEKNFVPSYDIESFVNSIEKPDRKSTRLNSSHIQKSRMPSSA